MATLRKKLSQLFPTEVGEVGNKLMIEVLPEVMGWSFVRDLTTKAEQESIGDGAFASNCRVFRTGKASIYAESKAEKVNKYGNLFLEIWSNRTFNVHRNPGWMVKCRSDYLFYTFLQDADAYIIPFQDLWEWFWGIGERQPAMHRHYCREQKKTKQKNVTVGYPVNIGLLCRELPSIKKIHVPEIVDKLVIRDMAASDERGSFSFASPKEQGHLFD